MWSTKEEDGKPFNQLHKQQLVRLYICGIYERTLNVPIHTPTHTHTHTHKCSNSQGPQQARDQPSPALKCLLGRWRWAETHGRGKDIVS